MISGNGDYLDSLRHAFTYAHPLPSWNPYGDIAIAGKPIDQANTAELKRAALMLDHNAFKTSADDRKRLHNAITYYLNRKKDCMSKSTLIEAKLFLEYVEQEVLAMISDLNTNFHTLHACTIIIGELAIVRALVTAKRVRTEVEGVLTQLKWIERNMLMTTRISEIANEYREIILGIRCEDRDSFKRLISKEEMLLTSIEEVRTTINHSCSVVARTPLYTALRLLRDELGKVRTQILCHKGRSVP